MGSNETETVSVLSDTTRYVFYCPCDPRFVWDLLDSSLGFCRCRIYNLSNWGSFERGNNHSSKTKERTA